MIDDPLLERAIERASDYLLWQAAAGFAEARHDMTFPREAGFTGEERQSGDIFVRAVLGSLALDVAELDRAGSARATAFHHVARREADYVASAKLRDRRGGWSYFPDLPEQPPDLDTLSAALSLFTRVAPDHVALCLEPLDLALRGVADDGSVETWIVAPEDAEADRARMTWGIQQCWGTGTDPDVLANFCQALLLADPHGHAGIIARGAAKLVALQQPDGSWLSTWYWGPVYGTVLGVRLLWALAAHEDSLRSALDFLRRAQRGNGAWGGSLGPLPLETALGMWALCTAGGEGTACRVASGCDWLLGVQNPDGSWFSSPWIQMPVGRPTGAIVRVVTHESVAVTTAFCLRSLLAARAHRRAGARDRL